MKRGKTAAVNNPNTTFVKFLYLKDFSVKYFRRLFVPFKISHASHVLHLILPTFPTRWGTPH